VCTGCGRSHSPRTGPDVTVTDGGVVPFAVQGGGHRMRISWIELVVWALAVIAAVGVLLVAGLWVVNHF